MFIDEEISALISEFEKPIEKWKNYQILVTGSTGHLGYYFTNFLIQADRKFNLNLKLTFTAKGLMHSSFTNFKSNFKYIQGDILEHGFVDSLGEFDCIIHLAGYAQPSIFIADPSSTIKINTEIVTSLLKKLNSSGSFLFISSSEVYTNSEAHHSNENINSYISSDHPRAPYILSKLVGESLCLAELDNTNKNIRVARLSMVYGPGIKKNDTRVISQFLHKALFNKKIVLLDQGKDQREYLYISDAVRALLNIMLFGKQSVYNIGAGHYGSITVADVAKIIADIAQVKVEVPEKNDVNLAARKNVGLDITRYESEFEVPVKIPFATGIRKTFEWAQNDWLH